MPIKQYYLCRTVHPSRWVRRRGTTWFDRRLMRKASIRRCELSTWHLTDAFGTAADVRVEHAPTEVVEYSEEGGLTEAAGSG